MERSSQTFVANVFHYSETAESKHAGEVALVITVVIEA